MKEILKYWPWPALLVVMVGGDALIDWNALPRLVQAFLDPPVHGAVGALVVYVAKQRRESWRARDVLAAAMLAVLIDVDHVIAAGSLSPSTWITLPMRPASHSLTFAAVAGLALGAITRNLSTALVVFAALASHVLRDAWTGITPLLYPALGLLEIPYVVYLASELALALMLARLAPQRAPRWRPALSAARPEP